MGDKINGEITRKIGNIKSFVHCTLCVVSSRLVASCWLVYYILYIIEFQSLFQDFLNSPKRLSKQTHKEIYRQIYFMHDNKFFIELMDVMFDFFRVWWRSVPREIV